MRYSISSIRHLTGLENEKRMRNVKGGKIRSTERDTVKVT